MLCKTVGVTVAVLSSMGMVHSGGDSSDDDSSTVCPGLLSGTPLENEDLTIPDESTYNDALSTLDISAVFGDLYDLMYDSQDCWPADEFNDEKSYAGLFLRLAWHCAGTFRDTDGNGGCAGGRQRYQPESAWDDNVNLDKGRALLAPIKEAYGDALSWGDLFVFSGTAAILAGDGPVTEVCAGRIDNTDGSLSDVLNDDSTCNPQGNCQEPLGSSTTGLIYVDPTGFLGNPDPSITAPHIREIFGRMGMNDFETVALIGGGHAFGKCHGPCPNGPGPGPDEQPLNPWPGLCGNNFPQDTYTSGLEGQWTKYPFNWDNEFFTQLRDDEFELITGPGDKYQWYNTRNGQLMLTTDIALVSDDDYKTISHEYANDISKLDMYFSSAWEKLTTSGGTWANNKFCVDGETLRPNIVNNFKCPVKSEYDCNYDDNCKTCPNGMNGCSKCNDGYFKKGWGYECASCNDIYNGKCQVCKDFKGCKKCIDGYSIQYDEGCGLNKCVKDY